MRTATSLLVLTALLLPAAAVAEEATARVRGLYYEAARGVLVDARMNRRASAPRWADVELEGEHAPERKRQLVQLPPEMNASVGDLVALRLGEPKSTQLAEVLPATAANRALAVTPHAPQFAGSNASSGASTVK